MNPQGFGIGKLLEDGAIEFYLHVLDRCGVTWT
jgi:hypothetical protein